MKFTSSLKKNFQFKTVYTKGKSIANKNLVVYIFPNNKDKNYLGISVSKKVGKSVVRSKVTRLIKESYRLNEYKIKRGYDIVVVARITAAKLNYNELNNSFKHLLKKHRIYSNLSL